LGEDTGHSKTIGNWGCLLVVYNMLARYYRLTDLYPDLYNSHMVEAGCFIKQYLLAAALRTAHPVHIDYKGYEIRSSTLMVPRIDKYLGEGVPVPARVDFIPSTDAWEQHWVLLIDKSGDDYVIVDPWTGKQGLLSEVYGIPGIDVLEAIFYRLKE
jgi:hypothetical protein